MPRTGITQNQLLDAIAALEARGESVTKITVRKELGDTGSFGTISAFLAQWRSNAKAAQQIPAAPIPDPVQAMFASAWATARAEAQAEVSGEREALAASKASFQAELAAVVSENKEAERALEDEIEERNRKLIEFADRYAATQRRIEDLAERVGFLTAQLETQNAREKALEHQVGVLEAENRVLGAGKTEMVPKIDAYRG